VEQFDTLVDELTVAEMLMYTAELKRSRHEPLAVRRHATSMERKTAILLDARCRSASLR